MNQPKSLINCAVLVARWAEVVSHHLAFALAVDFFQLKVLVKIAVRASFRGHEPDSSKSERSIRSGFRNMLVTYFITSMGLSAMSAVCGNLITYNTLIISYGMMMTAFAVLIEYNDLILNADDAEILFSKPITSQTIYWARLITLTLFVLLYSASLLLMPSMASFRFAKSKFYLMPFSFLIMMIGCLVSAFLVVHLYVQLLKRFDPNRLTGLLTYFQAGFSLVLFYGYYKLLLYKQAAGSVSIARAVENVQAAASSGSNPFNLILDQSVVFYFLPPSWFAGSIDLLLGDTTLRTLNLSMTALCVIVGVGLLMFKVAPASYLHHLVAHALDSHSQPGWRDVGEVTHSRIDDQQWRLRGILSRFKSALRSTVGSSFPPLTRAGYHLVSRYLKRDGRLRRGIYPFFGIILFYFLYGIENRNFLIDIFQAHSGTDVLGAHSVYVLLPLCVLIATNATKYCSDWRAAWIFYVAPVELRQFHLGYRLATLARIYGPIWLLLLLLYFFKMSLVPLLLQMLALFLIILFLLSLSFLFDPHLALSQAPRLHAGFLKFTLILALLVAIAQGILILEYISSRHEMSIGVFYLALMSVTALWGLFEFRQLKRLEPVIV